MGTNLRGWLLDLYEDEKDGVRLWFILDDGSRVCLHQSMPISFYAAGKTEQLCSLWEMLKNEPGVISLSREMRKDVFVFDPVATIQIVVDNPVRQIRLFQNIQRIFPDLTYYDTDISITTRHSALFQTFPMAACEVATKNGVEIENLVVKNSRWDIEPMLPIFRVISIEPDCDPNRGIPQVIRVQYLDRQKSLLLDDPVELINLVTEVLEQADPDIVLTNWGDNWTIPALLKAAEQTGLKLNLNRDEQRAIKWQKELTYFSYGQIVYRAEEAHLFGRCHIDRRNAMMWKDYGLDGVLESARVTAQSIERAARVSPGSGISAMQMLTALENQILVPWHKQQVEAFKTGIELIQRDRGGLIYQPLMGVHANVAQIDFISMYPAVIVKGNISPEVPLPTGIKPASDQLGVVPLTLKPLYEKRVALKMVELQCGDDDLTLKRFKSRASALKWLLVVCFGFLGYKNARFGRIEAHEAVTNGGREVLLQAKSIVEEMGFETLHLFADALWVKKEGAVNRDDFLPVLAKITQQTELGVSLDGVFKWIVFMPSRSDSRVPVANRYFGVFQDGTLKIRGIEARRRDTPPWVYDIQMKMIDALSHAKSIDVLAPAVTQAFKLFQRALNDLRTGQIPIEKLVVTSRITHDLEAYKSPTPAVRAAKILLEKTGKRIRPGQKMRFLYTKNSAGVSPWEVQDEILFEQVDKEKYIELLSRAASSILCPFGVDNNELKQWAHSATIELQFNFKRQVKDVRPVFDHVRPRRTEGYLGTGGSAN